LNVYAESSAVLAWLLGESSAGDVTQVLGAAEIVIASDLTLIECERALIRYTVSRRLTEGKAADLRVMMNGVAAHWQMSSMEGEIIERARRPFPDEPVRTLDALHLASALAARAVVPDLALLSLDDRVRKAGRSLGFEVRPR